MGLLNFLFGEKEKWTTDITVSTTIRNGMVAEQRVNGYSDRDESNFTGQMLGMQEKSTIVNKYPNCTTTYRAMARKNG
ncbi:MAG: hypothetical protein Q7R52_05290 [archaeon]|nr:hypothetical protein [archaeon]